MSSSGDGHGLLTRAGWETAPDGLSARLPESRLLAILLLVLVAVGIAMLGYFLAVTEGPYAFPLWLAVLGILGTLFAAVRSLRSASSVSFTGGVFTCGSGGLGFRSSTTLALGDIERFEARSPAHHKDVAHVVAHLKTDWVRLPLAIAEAEPLQSQTLALQIAIVLNDMLDDARRARPRYR